MVEYQVADSPQVVVETQSIIVLPVCINTGGQFQAVTLQVAATVLNSGAVEKSIEVDGAARCEWQQIIKVPPDVIIPDHQCRVFPVVLINKPGALLRYRFTGIEQQIPVTRGSRVGRGLRRIQASRILRDRLIGMVQ